VDPFLPYLAGFYDGEGTVGIYGRGRNGTYSLTAGINQLVSPASTQLFSECQVRWGGRFSIYRPGTRDACSWSLPGQKAYDFLVELRPWVRLKLGQVELAIEWWENRYRARNMGGSKFDGLAGRAPTPAEALAYDRSMSDQLKALKRA